jgi:hypothetical protein
MALTLAGILAFLSPLQCRGTNKQPHAAIAQETLDQFRMAIFLFKTIQPRSKRNAPEGDQEVDG